MTRPLSDLSMRSHIPPDCRRDNNKFATLDLIDKMEFYSVTPPYAAAAAVPATLLDQVSVAHIDTLLVLHVAAASAWLAVGTVAAAGTLPFAAVVSAALAADTLTPAGVGTSAAAAAAVGTSAAAAAATDAD